jgi:hypothetical protein
VTTTSYAEFLAAKRAVESEHGRPCSVDEVHPLLHPWQAEIVAWAVRKGRAALWEDTGLGKTVQQLEWARLSADTSLIVAPLAVCHQTAREAERRLDLRARYVRSDDEITGPGVWITNTELATRFDPARFGAAVLDEASILKQSTGRTRTQLVEHFADVPRRLVCTATPAPNDPEELTGQAEFLGVCSRVDMLATYFIHDDQGWRLKRHAVEPMYRWMSSWAVALRRPSDLGPQYSDDGYDLPGLQVLPELLDVDVDAPGQLFATDLGGVGGRAKIRRETLGDRCARAAELVAAEPDEPWLLWCGMNAEANELAEIIPGAVNVHGAMSPEAKAEALLGFADGEIRYLITKPKIASFGMNWQHCARMSFVGLSDSYEQYYQAIRRCLRYGQPRVVRAHVVLSRLEAQIARNVERKATEAGALTDGLVAAMRAAHTMQEAS